MSRNDELRDAEGRSYLAPAWSGDINDLTAIELHHRVEELGAHIGRLSTEYLGDGKWRANRNINRDAGPWIEQRLACLRRIQELEEQGEPVVRA